MIRAFWWSMIRPRACFGIAALYAAQATPTLSAAAITRDAEVVDRRHREVESAHHLMVEPACVALKCHREKHRRVWLKPGWPISARNLAREPARIFGGVLGYAAAARHANEKRTCRSRGQGRENLRARFSGLFSGRQSVRIS